MLYKKLSKTTICKYCYTQLTDVQQEINGLMDEKRNYKIESNMIKNVNLGLFI